MMVTRRLLKRFSSREGIEGHGGVLWTAALVPGLRVNFVCRCYITLGETYEKSKGCG
jgi:hypothetical protein